MEAYSFIAVIEGAVIAVIAVHRRVFAGLAVEEVDGALITIIATWCKCQESFIYRLYGADISGRTGCGRIDALTLGTIIGGGSVSIVAALGPICTIDAATVVYGAGISIAAVCRLQNRAIDLELGIEESNR